MLLNEIINEVGMTKRAVKYYEEKGLLSVDKDSNGYRNYSAQDVETLKKISVYRKLGIGIKDIQSLLKTGDKSILLRIYQEKLQEKVLQDSELKALKQFIDDGNADKANELLDYQTVENAIESLLPGKEWGEYLKNHFKPFLNVRLKTPEQKQALRNILEYCDNTTLKIPFIMGLGVKMAHGIVQETRTAEEMISYYRDMSESEYERLKEVVLKGAKIKTGIMKYHPSFVAQRKMQKEFQDKGYNDIFIPNLMALSPQYAEYKKALDNKILVGFNDLASQHPQIASEWSERNYPLKPDMVTVFANRKVWWRCSKGHEWNTFISTRSGGSGCPYCSGQLLLKGFNDFATTHPQLAQEWSDRNLPLTPDMINEKSRRNVWWKCRECGYEWQSVVYARVKGTVCPVCADRAVMTGYNDLATTDTHLLSEWDYERNKDIFPNKISRNSMQSVWWKCSLGHSWKAKISERAIEGKGCKVCEKDYLTVFPKLAVMYYAAKKHIKVQMDTDKITITTAGCTTKSYRKAT